MNKSIWFAIMALTGGVIGFIGLLWNWSLMIFGISTLYTFGIISVIEYYSEKVIR
jgi:hypothetical protein